MRHSAFEGFRWGNYKMRVPGSSNRESWLLKWGVICVPLSITIGLFYCFFVGFDKIEIKDSLLLKNGPLYAKELFGLLEREGLVTRKED